MLPAIALASPPIAIAGGVALTVGSMVLPTDNAGYDGAYALAVKNAYGPNVDPDHLTPAQAAHMTERYSGPLAFANSISDGMDYKYEEFLKTVGVSDAFTTMRRLNSTTQSPALQRTSHTRWIKPLTRSRAQSTMRARTSTTSYPGCTSSDWWVRSGVKRLD